MGFSGAPERLESGDRYRPAVVLRAPVLIRRLLTVVTLALVLIVGSAQWWALREANRAVSRLASQWQAYGMLRYDWLWVNLWGTAWLGGVSFEPAGLTQAMLGTPLDYRISARRLHLHGLGFTPDRRLRRLRLHITDLTLPMTDGYRLRARDAPPSLAAMGYASLRLQTDLDVRLLDDPSTIRILGSADGRDSGRANFELALQTRAEALRLAPDQVVLRHLRLDFRDQGLMTRYRDRRAVELGLRRDAAPQALSLLLTRRVAMEKWQWDAASVSALQGFLADPHQGLRAVFDPPGRVLLRDFNRYAVGEWPARLGFALQLAPAGD